MNQARCALFAVSLSPPRAHAPGAYTSERWPRFVDRASRITEPVGVWKGSNGAPENVRPSGCIRRPCGCVATVRPKGRSLRMMVLLASLEIERHSRTLDRVPCIVFTLEKKSEVVKFNPEPSNTESLVSHNPLRIVSERLAPEYKCILFLKKGYPR